MVMACFSSASSRLLAREGLLTVLPLGVCDSVATDSCAPSTIYGEFQSSVDTQTAA